MEFFLITCAVMAVVILVVHRVTDYLGFGLKWRPLALCAVMAVIANVIALMVSSYITFDYVALIFILIIASAALMTYYNEYLLKHDPEWEPAESALETVEAKLHSAAADGTAERVLPEERVELFAAELPEEPVVQPEIIAPAPLPTELEAPDLTPVAAPIPEPVVQVPPVPEPIILKPEPEVIPEPESENIPETEPEIVLSSEPEIIPESEQEFVPELGPEVIPEQEPEAVPGSESEVVQEPESEIVPEPEPEVITEPESEFVPELEPEVIPEQEPEIIPEPEPEVVPEAEPEVVPEPKPEIIPAHEPEAIPEPEQEIVPEPEPEVIPEPEPEIISEPEPEIIPEPEPVKPATGSFVIGPGGFSFVIPDKIEEPAKPVPEPTPEPMPETAEIVPEPEPEIVSVPEPEVIPETAPEPEIAPEPNLKPEIPADKLAGLTTLDDFLDYAYSEKDTGNLPLAAAALAMAVERFGDNSYAPFVVIELANVYKSQGNYEAAIKAYQEAYSLPAVAADEFAAAQFRSSEEYLTKLMTVLEKHGKPGLSFTEIPEDYFREIL